MAWIITNAEDNEFCWSNTYGWVTEDYDTFTDEEHNTLLLPFNGTWEQVNWQVRS